MSLTKIMLTAATGIGLATPAIADPSETFKNFEDNICQLLNDMPELFWRRNKSFDDVGNAFIRLGFISTQEQLDMTIKFIKDAAKQCSAPRNDR